MNANWINKHSNTPKYLQIVNAVKSCIEKNTLTKGDALPSVNKLLQQYEILRDTVVKAC
jgi:DNA-binding GntR family transcriptional regulator